MRRAYLAVLSLIATMFALMGGEYLVVASSGGEQVSADDKLSDDVWENADNALDSLNGDSSSSSASPEASVTDSASPTATATATGPGGGGNGGGNGGGGNGGGGNGGGDKPPTLGPCKVHNGDNVWIGEIGRYGKVYVDIKVCGTTLTEAKGGVLMSNYDPQNGDAIAALDQLAVRYYKSDISMISYAGATATAKAYQASLRTAMNQAGI